MPRIFDNIEQDFVTDLRKSLSESTRADFCVGYFRLRGWNLIADLVDRYKGGDDSCCRVLVGMHRAPPEYMRAAQGLVRGEERLGGTQRARMRDETIADFRQQLEFGIPSLQAQETLRKLVEQLRSHRLQLKQFMRYPLHAKLYVVHRDFHGSELLDYIGSSNLTLAGLTGQGELNIDVADQDAARKLSDWFEERWADSLNEDLSLDLADLIADSWAGDKLREPYLVYLKMAYHLSMDARKGEEQFKLPDRLQKELLNYQVKAVQLVCRKLYTHGGVLLADVVGLGKTLMATAVAKVFQEDDRSNTLVICPPKLKEMWDYYRREYELVADVVSLGKVATELPKLPSYRTVVIDESHNLRNRDGQRYRAIRDYIETWNPRVILLTATPFNKEYEDLSNQLRLFIDEDQDLGVRPNRFLKWWCEQKDGRTEYDFRAEHDMLPGSLRAFEKSDFPEDWRDLMQPFLVRRTRQFIIESGYAKYDEVRKRHYVLHGDDAFYFPLREPKRITFPSLGSQDPYDRLFRDEVVSVIEHLVLPRYGLLQYLIPDAKQKADPDQRKVIENLSKAGKRLIGFSRTNLFKRLESCGHSFLLSVRRHVLRNYIYMYALEFGLPLPIGTQNASVLDTALTDVDADFTGPDPSMGSASTIPDDTPPKIATIELLADRPMLEQFEEYVERSGDPRDREWLQREIYDRPEALSLSVDGIPEGTFGAGAPTTADDRAALRKRAVAIYAFYREHIPQRFDWLPAALFQPGLAERLSADAESLLGVLRAAGEWNPEKDSKLAELENLIRKTPAGEKLLIFTQFADTALYLYEQLEDRRIKDLAVATNASADPVHLARRFSPKSNGGLSAGESELRVLIATDVLAEGQNLQDCARVVNYDLPWAIVRLTQRAGRVDRIGQEHDTIYVFSFWPTEGVDRLIRLRGRLMDRLRANQEVIGSDESFFGEEAKNRLRDLYTEKRDSLEDAKEKDDTDWTSQAQRVWESAPEDLRKKAAALPAVVYATKAHLPGPDAPAGVLTYVRYERNKEKYDLLLRVDSEGHVVSHSMPEVFRAAACESDTKPLTPMPNHLALVEVAVKHTAGELRTAGGQLGNLRSVSRKVYDRLKVYRQELLTRPTLFSPDLTGKLDVIMDLLFRHPLKERARESLSRQMKLGINDEALVRLMLQLHEDGRLCEEGEAELPTEPTIVCSMGLKPE